MLVAFNDGAGGVGSYCVGDRPHENAMTGRMFVICRVLGRRRSSDAEKPQILAAARQIIGASRIDYNIVRPRSSLGGMTSAETANRPRQRIGGVESGRMSDAGKGKGKVAADNPHPSAAIWAMPSSRPRNSASPRIRPSSE